MGDNAQDLCEVKGLTGQATDVEEWGGSFSRAFLCYTQGVFQQPLIFVSRLKGQGETHLLLHTMACFRVNQREIVFLSGQDY